MSALTPARLRKLRRNWYLHEERGFSDEVPVPVGSLYFRALMICAKGDGVLSPAERDWILGFAATLGHSDDFLHELDAYKADEDLEQLLAALSESQDARFPLVYDSIRACHADGEYHTKEKQRVHQIAEKVGCPADVVNRLEQIHEEEKKLAEEKRGLLFAGGVPF